MRGRRGTSELRGLLNPTCPTLPRPSSYQTPAGPEGLHGDIVMSDALAFATRERPRFEKELFDFLRIPSVSAKSEHDPDTRAAAAWLADNLKRAGLQVEVLETPKHPVVI